MERKNKRNNNRKREKKDGIKTIDIFICFLVARADV